MGNPEDETVADLGPYEFNNRAKSFRDTLNRQIPKFINNHQLETIDVWDESNVQIFGQVKRAMVLRGLHLFDDAIVAQARSDREDRESAHRELVGVACYGKIERTIEEALEVIESMASKCRGSVFGQDVWDDFDHGDMVGIRFFVFNG